MVELYIPKILCFLFFNFNGFWRENYVTRLTAKFKFQVMAKQINNFERADVTWAHRVLQWRQTGTHQGACARTVTPNFIGVFHTLWLYEKYLKKLEFWRLHYLNMNNKKLSVWSYRGLEDNVKTVQFSYISLRSGTDLKSLNWKIMAQTILMQLNGPQVLVKFIVLLCKNFWRLFKFI